MLMKDISCSRIGVFAVELQGRQSVYLVPFLSSARHVNGHVSWTNLRFLHPLPNNKILDQFKFEAHVEDNINVTQNLNFVLGKVENILGKGENAGYQHFLLFPKCFQKAAFSRVDKNRGCALKGQYIMGQHSVHQSIAGSDYMNRQATLCQFLVRIPISSISFLRTDDSHCDRIHSSLRLNIVSRMNICIWEIAASGVGNILCDAPTKIKILESMDRFSGRVDITKVILKKPHTLSNQTNFIQLASQNTPGNTVHKSCRIKV